MPIKPPSNNQNRPHIFKCTSCGAWTTVGSVCICQSSSIYSQQFWSGVWGTNGAPSYSNSHVDIDDEFLKLKERMLKTKLQPRDEFDELMFILIPDFSQEVLDYLWNEFESNYLPPSLSWAGLRRNSNPDFWLYALVQERNKRELALEEEKNKFKRLEEEFKRTKNMRPDNLRAYENQLLKPETHSETMKEFQRKYLINKRKGVI